MSFLIFAIFLIIIAPLLAMSIENWVFLWVLLELSSVGFIIFMKSLEMSVIYFLTQTFGSILILFHLVFWKENLYLSFSISPTLLTLGLILKMGMAPMHQWFLSVGSKIKKGAFLALMTVQKIVPLFIFKMFLKVSVIPTISLVSVILGVYYQMGVFNFKKLILYSSIVNMGWLILISSFHLSFLIIFFTIYSIILSLLVPYTETQSIEIVLGFMSLAGIPPLLGFFSKLIALKVFSVWSELWGFLLLILSVINTFIYFRVFMKFSLKTPSLMFNFLNFPFRKTVFFMQIGLPMLIMIV